MNKLNYIVKPRRFFNKLIDKLIINYIKDDEKFLKIQYRRKMNKKLNLNNPLTYNEKLQWLKLHDRKKIYTTMVDKYDAKKYVANIIGEEYIIPTIGIYNSFDEINFDELPNQFVIKCTHDSGGVVICRDKNILDIDAAKRKIIKSLKVNYYKKSREWPYKNVKPRIIIEKYMEDKKSTNMRDYKFFCFNGIPKLMYLSEGLENHKTASMSFFDMNFQKTSCKRSDYKLLDYNPEKPKTFEKMKEFSKLLSKDIPHLRVDWYEIDGNLYFGELTFSTCSGFLPFESEEWNKKLGGWIELPNENKKIGK